MALEVGHDLKIKRQDKKNHANERENKRREEIV